MEKKMSFYKIGLVLLSLLLLVSVVTVAACGKSDETASPTPTTVPTQSPTATPALTPTLIIVPTSTPTSTPEATPTATPTKVVTPQPTYTIPAGYVSERLVLLVEPSQPRIISLFAPASTNVQVALDQITPSDVPIGVTVINPYNETILNIEKIKAPGFSFEAINSGNYIIYINISPILLTNAVVILEVQHPGAAQYPTPSGIYVIVEHGKTMAYDLDLSYADRVQGSFTIEGGNKDLYFSFLDPSDNPIGFAGRVASSHSLSAKVNTSGKFKFEFNNTHTYTTKLVTLQYSVSR